MTDADRFTFVLPDLGEGLAEAEVVAWLRAPGTSLRMHDPIVEVQTDKALVELPAPVEGTLEEIFASVGDIVSVGQALAVFRVAGGSVPAPRAESAAPDAAPVPDGTSAVRNPAPDGLSATTPRAIASPAVRRFAMDAGVDLRVIVGSGPSGRVERADVECHLAAIEPTPRARSSAAPPPPTENDAADERRPLRGLRRAVAQAMTNSWRTIPHVTGMLEVDVTDLAAWRDELKTEFPADIPLTWSVVFAYATVQALVEHSILNASLDDEREEIVVKRRINLGVATATPDGLLVPVVRDAHSLSLAALAQELHRVTERARARRCTPDELSGGSFTISNYGTLGGWFGTPLILHPQVAIAGFGAISLRPAYVDGAIVPRSVLALSVSVDHRVADGDVLNGFTASLARRLSKPVLLALGNPPW